LEAIFVDFVLLLQLYGKKLAYEHLNVQENIEQSNLAVSSAKLVAPCCVIELVVELSQELHRASKNKVGTSAWRRPPEIPTTQLQPLLKPTICKSTPSIVQYASTSAHKRQ
jgi:hypothetical protein